MKIIFEKQVDDRIRSGVVDSLPEAAKIKNQELREKVYDAWALSLQMNEMQRIEEMEGSGVPGKMVLMNGGNQADHLNGVTRLAIALAVELKDLIPEFDVDIDEVIAGGLCHDLGKPYEYNVKKRKQWMEDPSDSGFPAVRHPPYGVFIALTAGLPEKIAHIAGAHSREGRFVEHSLACEIVHRADESFWNILKCSGIVKLDLY